MSAPSTPPRRPAKRIQPTLSTISDGVVAGPSTTTGFKPRDPAIERALQLSTFESNYSTEDFIGTLSEKLIAESKANPGALDPKPFLQTFSPALDSLLALRQQVAERTKKMESEVRRAEREYGKRLRELDGGFEAIGSSFSTLETKITDVSRTAVRIGEQLESLHQTRSNAQSTSLILSYYLSLVHQTSTTPDPSNPTANPLETLFATRTSREGRSRLSIILRRLMAVAKDMADNAATAVTEAEASIEEDDKEKMGKSKMLVKKRSEKEKAERVRDEVERYCERFEKEVLRLFDRSYRKGDPRMMAHCAKTLQDFNGGASCVQIYVNQHDFFISKDRVIEEAEKAANGEGENGEGIAQSSDLWSSVGNPDEPPPTSEPGMAALIKEIRVTVGQEAQIVKAVFPNPRAVMQVFLQRVFAQVIQQQLETLVSRAQAISTLAVLRILSMAHSMCVSLLEELKTYDVILAAPIGGTSRGSGGTGPLAAMLDHSMEEIFVPWLEGSRYLESESKNLVELFAGLLSRFTRYHETVLKAKPNSLLDKVVSQLSSTSAGTSTSTAQAAAAAISKYANVFTSSGAKVNPSPINAQKALLSPTLPTKSALPSYLSHGNGAASPVPRSGAMTPVGGRPGLQRADSMKGEMVNKGLEDKVWATDGVLTLEMAERMLKWHAESIGRVVELSPTSEVGKNAFALSKVLGEAIGRSFIETALDSALARLEGTDSKVEPDLTPLSALKPADLICHLAQRYASTALLPLAGSSAPLRREMITFNSHNVVRMEGKINNVLQKAVDNIINYLAFVLTKQKKNDYKPKDDELSFARTNTEPCRLGCEFLETVRDTVREGLSGKNAEAFLTEVGVAFHSLLLDHYKKFPVNPTGGLMLTKDLASYQDIMSCFGIPALNERFDMLRQLGNTFIVQPNVLKSYMTESHLGRIDTRLLRPYLAQRSDWSTFSRTLVLDDGLPVEAADPNGGMSSNTTFSNLSAIGGKSNMFKGSRLSTMSGVAGAGMGKLKDMLKELDTISPEEDAAMRSRAKDMRNRYSADYGRPMFFPVH